MQNLGDLIARANRGDIEAQRIIEGATGQPEGLYSQLLATTLDNNKKAVGGDVEAMIALGSAHYAGIGVRRNIKLARYWYREAAKKGDMLAMYRLGVLYYVAHNNYERALQYVMAAVNRSIQTRVRIPKVTAEEVNHTIETLSVLVRARDWERNIARYTASDFASKIEALRWYFGRLSLPAKQEFIRNLQYSASTHLKNYPKYRKFVNECVAAYNADVKKHNSEVQLQDLRAYFDDLNFPSKFEFIQKLQTSPPEIKNQPRYRKLTNEAVADYNTEIRQYNRQIMEIRELQKPRPVSRNKVAKNIPTDRDRVYSEVAAQLDAHIAHLHYYGCSCKNCLHLNRGHCNNFAAILPRWRQEGYDVCQKWEHR